MPVNKNLINITVLPKRNEIYLSVFNPKYPIFRIHTAFTVINISSSFLTGEDKYILPLDSIVCELSENEYQSITRRWLEGVKIKRYEALPESVIDKISINNKIFKPHGR